MKAKRTGKLIGIGFTCIGVMFLIAWLGVAAFVRIAEVKMVLLLSFGIIGLLFTGLGLLFCFLLSDSRGKRKRERLLQTGERIYAKVESCEPNTTINVNGRCPYQLVCRYSSGDTGYIYRSADLWDYPRLTGDTVAVYVNPQDPHDYYVDVESVLEKTVEM